MEENQSEFSSFKRRIINIPLEQNIDDIKSGFNSFYSDSSKNFPKFNNTNKNNNYYLNQFRNNNNYINQNLDNKDDSSDDLDSGYSDFAQNLPLSGQKYNNQIPNNNNYINLTPKTISLSPISYNMNTSPIQSPNIQILNNIIPDNYQNYENKNYSPQIIPNYQYQYSNNIIYNTPQNIQNYQNLNYNNYNNYISPKKSQDNQNLNYNTYITPMKIQNYQNINYNNYIIPKESINYQIPNNNMNIDYQKYYSYNINTPPQKIIYYPTSNFNIITPEKKNVNNENLNFKNPPQLAKITKINDTTNININKITRVDYKNNPEEEPIPQDTIVDDESEMNNNSPKNNNNNNLKDLFAKCRKNGIPPPDGDFSLEGWKLFYSPDEKFFLWDKGRTIPNQIRIKNENDEEEIEIYEGEVNKNDEKHGLGILTTPKYVRKGTWRDGEFTGWCRESRVNGDIFEGKFIDGSIYGKGIYKSHNGNLYVGDFTDNIREGKGELRTKKVHYIGEFKYNKFNGNGKLIFIKEGHSYEGNFINNQISGIGIFKWSNGDIYEGEMKNGKMNGYGKYMYKNGQIYEGNYIDGVKHGLGKLIYPDNKIYEGEFKNGKPEGEGTIFMNGKKIDIVSVNGKFQKK